MLIVLLQIRQSGPLSLALVMPCPWVFFYGRLPHLFKQATMAPLHHKLEGIANDNWSLIRYIVQNDNGFLKCLFCAIYFRLEETCRCRKLNSWQNQVMCNDPSVTSWGGQASNYNLQLVILSLWGIRSVIPLASICLGMIPNLIFWQ